MRLKTPKNVNGQVRELGEARGKLTAEAPIRPACDSKEASEAKNRAKAAMVIALSVNGRKE